MTHPVLHDIDFSHDLDLALRIADRVDRFTLHHFTTRDFSVDWKVNDTEVTEIDRDAESMIVSMLRAGRPDHAVFGEEHGLDGDESAEWQWVIDPIDGTSGFVRGIPVWATLIALTHVEHGPVLGVVSAPALDRRWWGGVRLGAFTAKIDTPTFEVGNGPNDEPTAVDSAAARRSAVRSMHVSTIDELTNAQVSVTHSPGWDDLGLTENLIRLQQQARRSRGMGDFWQHMLVAEGAMDVAVDAIGVAPYDLAALQPIVEAAGGRFTDRHGEATHRHNSAVSSNGLLHEAVIAVLNA